MNYIDGSQIRFSDFNVIEVESSKSRWIEITVQIKNNQTKKVVCLNNKIKWQEKEDEPFIWIWEEGNFACDCNRALFSGDGDIECSDGKYSVNLINPKNNKIIYQEFL